MESNPPGQSSISYRAGTWATFKETMLARLSSSDYPALADLKTRDNGDFTIAFLDATSVVLDILTFYQERLANENYLGTAVQQQSLTELSRLIGYQPSPGVSASTYVAFTLKAAPGQAPNPSNPAITIPQGTQVQSVPAQGQTPQTFETFADIQAKSDWNALPVQTGQPWVPPGTSGVYLSGTATQLKLGDSLLILGVEREEWNPNGTNPSEQWDVVVLNQVEVDNVLQVTYVAWDQRLLHNTGDGTSGDPSTWTAAKIFAFRQKAVLFGNNAPNANLFVNQSTGAPSLPNLINSSDTTDWQWKCYSIPSPSQIDLDAAYPKIVAGSWFALTAKNTATFLTVGEFGTDLANARTARVREIRSRSVSLPTKPIFFPLITTYPAQLYKVETSVAVSLAKFAMSGKVTELTPDYLDPIMTQTFQLNTTEVWAQSDELTIAEQPLDYPLYGAWLDLQDLRPDLAPATIVALSGNSQKITVADGIANLEFIPADGSAPMALSPEDMLTLTDPTPLPLNLDGSIPDWISAATPLTLNVTDSSGRPGTVQAALSNFTLADPASTDPVVGEYALVASVNSVTAPYPHTRIVLQSNLINCYDRAATTVNANAGLATQGQSVTEIMGNGSASTPDQTFMLKQSPLTFVQAPTPTGRQSTLQVQANGVTWTEVPSLYAQGPSQQVFATLNQPGGATEVLFGDGVEGATLPTGQNNIQANYRIGIGSAGNVGAGSVTTLIDRPIGVSGVANPGAATGGQDPDSIDDIRSNAPQTVLTLGRAVSITDYRSYASTFAGIAQAYALWIPNGPARGVFLTVAGVDGAALPPGNPTLTNLLTSLQNYGNPLVPITIVSFVETLFGLSANLQYASSINDAAARAGVQAQVLAALYNTYSFAARTFGQGVSADEVATVIQGVPGVVAVNVTKIFTVASSYAGDLASQGAFTLSGFYNWLVQQVNIPRPFSLSPTRICPYLPVANSQSVPYPAEILVLDPDPSRVTLGVMS